MDNCRRQQEEPRWFLPPFYGVPLGLVFPAVSWCCCFPFPHTSAASARLRRLQG